MKIIDPDSRRIEIHEDGPLAAAPRRTAATGRGVLGRGEGGWKMTALEQQIRARWPGLAVLGDFIMVDGGSFRLFDIKAQRPSDPIGLLAERIASHRASCIRDLAATQEKPEHHLIRDSLATQPWGFGEPDTAKRVDAFNAAIPVGTQVRCWVVSDSGAGCCTRVTTGVATICDRFGGPTIGIVAVDEQTWQIEHVEAEK